MTIADALRERQNKLTSSLSIYEATIFQEIAYRLSVLDVIARIDAAIPETTERSKCGAHYQFMMSYLHLLVEEHCFVKPSSDKAAEARACAKEMLIKILKDNEQRLMSFMPQEPGDYHKMAKNTLQTVTIAWISYRETFVRILNEKKDNGKGKQ